MRISSDSILTVKHKKNILKMIPVCSLISGEKPKIIADFDNTTLGNYMTDSVDEDANSTFAAKIKKFAAPLTEDGKWLFFATLEKFEDEWWGVYQVKYGENDQIHPHLLMQSVSVLIMKNESIDSPLEVHFELPISEDKEKTKDLFLKIFGKRDLKGEYVLHVIGG